MSDLQEFYKSIELPRDINPGTDSLKPVVTELIGANITGLLDDPRGNLGTILSSSIAEIKGAMYTDAILCIERAIHFYLAGRHLIQMGFLTPYELCMYYAKYFAVTGLFRLSSWGLVHLNSEAREGIVRGAKTISTDQTRLRKFNEFLSGTIVINYSWNSHNFTVEGSRGDEHHKVMEQLNQRFQGITFEGHYFISMGEIYGNWIEYYRSTRRNQYVYDLSYDPGNPSYEYYIDQASEHAGYDIFHPVVDDSENGPDPAYEAYKSTMVEEEDTWDDIRTLLRTIVRIGEKFEDINQRKRLGKRLEDYHKFCSDKFSKIPQISGVISQIDEELDKLRRSIPSS